MAQQPTLDELKTAIHKFSNETLKEILENLGDKNTKAAERVNGVVDNVLEISAHTFTKKLGNLLSTVNKEVKVDKESELRDHINKKTLDKVLSDLSEDTLTDIMKKFGLDETKDKGEMEKQILDETFLNGAKEWLTKLKVTTVRAISADLKVNAKKSDTKDVIVDSLMAAIFNFKEDAAEEKSKKKSSQSKSKKRSRSRSASRSRSRSASPKRSSSKSGRSRSRRSASPAGKRSSSSKSNRSRSPSKGSAIRGAPRPPTSDIKKGDTYTKLYDTYNVTDLVAYCRDNKLPVSGAKKVVIKRILDYLETGVAPDPKDRVKKRKRGGSYPLKPKKKKAKEDGDDDSKKEKKEKKEKSESKSKKSKKSSDDSSAKSSRRSASPTKK